MRITSSIRRMIPAYIFVSICLLLTAIFTSRSVTVISENTFQDNRTCVIIDAGHGGVDGGATSVSGVLESNINLAYAKRLNDVLNLLGVKTYMIRSDDRSIYVQGDTIAAKKVSDLKERVRITNSYKNAVLISIHQNYFSDSQYSGAQVFYAKTDGSKELADRLQADLRLNINGSNKRKIKASSGVYLLDHIENTGVLIECGFLSNYEEDVLLRSEDYQKKMCSSIAVSICNYLDQRNNN